MMGGDWYPSLFAEYPSLYVSLIELSFTISLFCSNPALFTRNKPRKLTKDLLTGFFLLYLLVYLIPDYESDPLSMYPDPLSELTLRMRETIPYITMSYSFNSCWMQSIHMTILHSTAVKRKVVISQTNRSSLCPG